MLHCNPCHTPVETKAKSSISNGHPLANPTEYHSLVVALQSLTLTHPDITYAVQQACLFMHAPATSDHTLVKHILWYIKGTLHFGLQLSQSSSTDLIIFFDADWAACLDTSRSTSGCCAYFGGNLVSWSSKRYHIVSQSSAEVEYRGVANAVVEGC
jgi:hypothetical protein